MQQSPRKMKSAIKQNFRNLPILIAILLFIIFLYPISVNNLLALQQNTNFKILHYVKPRVREIKVPNFDPFYDNIISKLEEKNYKLNVMSNSKDIDLVLKNASQVLPILDNKKFNSNIDLLNYLSFRGEREAEREIINQIKLNNGETEDAIWHLVETYLTPVEEYVNENLFEKATFLSEQAFLGYRNTDVEPKSEVNYSINQILLSKALFEYPNVLVQENTAVKLLYKALINDFPKERRVEIEGLDVTDEILNLKMYWIAVYHFNEDEFLKCAYLVHNIKGNTNNFVLKSLSILMEARCYFWNSRANWQSLSDKDKENVVTTLRLLSSEVSYINSFATDIDFYTQEVLSWEKDSFN